MPGALPLAGLLCALLLSEGFARQCQTCTGPGPGQCTDIVQTCATSDDVCMTTYTSKTVGNVQSIELARMCGKSTACKLEQTIRAPSFTLRRTTRCCSSDNCTPPSPELPAEHGTEENGLVCSACFRNSYYCHTRDTMKCTGNESKCARYSLKEVRGSRISEVAMRGCASDNLCAVGNNVVSFSSYSETIYAACTDAASHPGRGLLAPILTGLVLLKVFC